MMNKVKVSISEFPLEEVCEYCEGLGYKSFKYFEEFQNEEVDFSYMCPSCKGIKKIISEDKTQKEYIKENIEYINRQEIFSDGILEDFNVELIDETDFYTSNNKSKMIIGDKFYLLERESDRGDTYFYFQDEDEANAFIESQKALEER